MLERLQKIIARAGIASRRHAEELIKSGLVTVNGQTITVLGSKADESKDHIKVQGKLLRPETERVYLLLNKPPEVVSTMIDPEGRRSLSDMLHGVAQRVFPVGRLEYHSLGLVFLTNDGELANQMLKAHHLPQTYNLKLKTLLTFDETAALEQSTGARITRIKGKDAPWYEVTLSEARRDALRNRLFQTGHPVEKIKRVKIGNLALEDLSAGHFRPLSDAEVNALRRMVQPGARQISSSATQAAAATTSGHSALPPTQTGISTLGIPAGIARRPFVKRRPYQPKPKTGEAKRPSQPLAWRDNAAPRPQQHFQNAPQDGAATVAPPPDRTVRFSRPPQNNFQNSRPGHPARPGFKSRPAAAGGRPLKPPFAKSQDSKSHGETPRGAWKPRPAFRREGPAGAKPHHGGKPFQKFRSDSLNRPDQDAEYDRPIKPKSEAPWRRTESQKPSEPQSAGGGPGSKFRKFPATGGSRKSGAPWKSRKPSEPGAFGRAKSKFSKPGGRPPGLKPRPGAGAPKRSSSRPGQHKPKPGNFTGPKGRR
jgi:23S rRNA pseudouridine2605 synthase